MYIHFTQIAPYQEGRGGGVRLFPQRNFPSQNFLDNFSQLISQITNISNAVANPDILQGRTVLVNLASEMNRSGCWLLLSDQKFLSSTRIL